MRRRAVLLLILTISFSIPLFSQSYKIEGTLNDDVSGDPLIGVNIIIKGTYIGTISDKDGKFSLESSIQPPYTLVFSMVGYKSQEIAISAGLTYLEVELSEEIIMGQEIVVAASRMEESLLQSSASVEKLDISDLRKTTSANFYDGLYNLKGVDMNVQSLTFRVPNTRGFNGNTNYRFNQFVDGVDNTPAGLGFAAGNIFGLSQLDVESVELLVGATSALYGPGGMNGTMLMTSKSPFEYQGFSSSIQAGVMHVGADYRSSPAAMTDLNLRYAKALNEKFAFKLTISYLEATDWHASDYRDINNLDDPNSTRENNEGYDGVNVYGDDIIVPVNLAEIAPDVAAGTAEGIGLIPGTPEYNMFVDSLVQFFPDQVISRNGWNEVDLVDYKTTNFRGQGSLNYRFADKYEAILAGGYASGTAVYTAQNRFSLVGFETYQARFEVKSPDWFVRVWTTGEFAGQTYDAGTTGLLMNEDWKSSEQWYEDYIGAFVQGILFGFPLQSNYDFARSVAQNRSKDGVVIDPSRPAFPLPGSAEFNNSFNSITSQPIPDGALVVDETSQWSGEAMYNFRSILRNNLDLVVGGQYRYYNIDSDGTVFFDEPGNPVNTWWWGAFAQFGARVFQDRLKMTISTRYDKHQKFESLFTPRASIVYSLDKAQKHNVRASIQSAFRYPSITDQWVDLDVGAFHVIGGLPEVQAKYGFDENPVFPLTGTNPIVDEPYLDEGPFIIPVFRPEEVIAFEAGYRGLYLKDKLFVDAYVFQNRYDGFLGAQLLAMFPNTPEEERYQTTISTDSRVISVGWAASADYRFPNRWTLKGNIAYNGITKDETIPGLQTQFNTPDYRLNLGLSKVDVLQNLSVNVNWRWQNSFFWESTFGSGQIPAYNTLDMVVAYRVKSIKSVFKIGGSNILNNYYTTGFGNAQVGGLYYITWEFDEFLN